METYPSAPWRWLRLYRRLKTIARQPQASIADEEEARIKAALAKPIEERRKPEMLPQSDPRSLPSWGITPLPTRSGKPRKT